MNLKIMTWNILAEEFIEPRYYSQIPKNILCNRNMRWQKINNIIQRFIQDDRGVVCLQEVMRKEFNALKEICLFHKYQIFKSPIIKWSYNGRTYMSSSFNVILLPDDLHIEKVYTFTFGVAVLLAINVLILNVHLSDDNNAMKHAQLQSLKYLFNYPRIILAGDLNEDYHIKDTSSYNIYTKLKAMNFEVHNHEYTYYHDEISCIDNILTKGLKSTNSKCTTMNSLDGLSIDHIYTYGSDHLPVICTIMI